MSSESYGLFDAYGRRKYLNADERTRFIAAAQTFGPEIEALCLLLHFTGCRISEALALRRHNIDPSDSVVIFQTLKQRKRIVFRMLPLPESVVAKLLDCAETNEAKLFACHRSTAWEKVTAVMRKAGVVGPQACPRGVRHGFGVAAISAGVPLTLVQRWLGHARMETTSIYLAVIGPEERRFARRMWRKSDVFEPSQTHKQPRKEPHHESHL